MNLFIRRITAIDYPEDERGGRDEEGGAGWEEGGGWREEEEVSAKKDGMKEIDEGRFKQLGRRNVPIKELKEKMW